MQEKTNNDSNRLISGNNSFLDYFLKPSQEDIKMAKNSINIINSQFWDPVYSVNTKEVSENCVGLLARWNLLKRNPKKMKKHYNITYIIFLIVFLILTFIITSSINNKGGIISLFHTGELFEPLIIYLVFLFIGTLPIMFMNKVYKDFVIDLVKLQIANEKNWLYNP